MHARRLTPEQIFALRRDGFYLLLLIGDKGRKPNRLGSRIDPSEDFHGHVLFTNHGEVAHFASEAYATAVAQRETKPGSPFHCSLKSKGFAVYPGIRINDLAESFSNLSSKGIIQ